MKTRQLVLAGMLLLIHVGCRGGGNAREEANTKSPAQEAGVKPEAVVPAQDTAVHAEEALPIPILDSTTASIQFKREKDGYRFFLQPKDKNARMESRCSWWTLDSLSDSKEISTLGEDNENICNNRLSNLMGQTADIKWVGKDSSTIARSYGSEYLAVFSLARRPIFFLGSIQYQGGTNSFQELPFGESTVTLSFYSDDACENQGGAFPECEKISLPPTTVGAVRLRIKIIVKEGQFEIREWP